MNTKLLKMLREDLIGELEAINQYQDHIDLIDDEEAKHVWGHIINDEKEHVAELVKYLRKVDPKEEEKFQKEGL